MTSSLPRWLTSFWPAASPAGRLERVRASAGALLGLLVTGALSVQMLGPGAAAWLIAPMGASAVLLFAVPASPLAQPWSIIGGNVTAGLIGVTVARWVSAPEMAGALAVGLAIAAMFALRCLHPPSGAVALGTVLGGPAVRAAGYGYVLSPVLLNSLLLLAAALVYNNLTRRRYPHAQQVEPAHPHQTGDVAPGARLGFQSADLQAVLKEYDQVLDVSADDLEALFHRTEMHAFRRSFGETTCGTLMSRDVLSVEFGTYLDDAWRQMREHSVQALPVIDRARRVIGIVTRSDFIYHADLSDRHGLGERLRALLRRTGETHSDKPEVVGQIMSSPARTLAQGTPIAELVPLMAGDGLHHVPVVDERQRLVGMVTQTDLVAALYDTSLARLEPGRG